MVSTALAHPLAPEQRAVTGRDLGWLSGCLLFVMAPHAVRVLRSARSYCLSSRGVPTFFTAAPALC